VQEESRRKLLRALQKLEGPPAKVTVRLFGAAAAISTGPPTVHHAQPTTIAPKPLVLLPPPLPFSIRSAALLLHTALQSSLGAAILLLASRVAHLARVGSIKNVATT
jgi:hypothetical protein